MLEEYVGANKKILHKCKVCENEWNAFPTNILQGHGCSSCANNTLLTNEEFNKKAESLKNSNIKIIGQYVNSKTKIDCLCLICGNIWGMKSSDIFRGSGCRLCYKNNSNKDKQKTHIQYISEILEKQLNVEPLETYNGASKKILHRCTICKNEWYIKPAHILAGHGCKKCADKENAKSKTKSNEQFLNELCIINKDIDTLEKYKNNVTPLLCMCKICGNKWYAYPNNLLRGHGCSVCSCSIGEKYIKNFLEKYNIKYIQQKTFDDLLGTGDGNLSYDFYLPKFNYLIEFQGKQHEQPIDFFGGEKQFEIQQEHDKRKREYAEKNNINLLEIWYYDIDNIESILLQKINEIKENNLKLESVETVIPA